MRQAEAQLLVLAAAWLVAPSLWAQDKATVVSIKVVDKRKSPVASALYLNPGMLPVGKTSQAGDYQFKHKCELGQTFKAQPEDRGRFYDSEEQVCGPVVVLEVFPRPVAVFKKDEVELFKLGEWQGLPAEGKVYAGVFGGVTGKVESLPGGRAGKCRVTLDKQYAFGVYSATSGEWKKLEQVKPMGIASQSDSVYVFPSPCSEAQPEIVQLKNRAQTEVMDAAKWLSVSPEVGVDVGKAMKGGKY